MGVPPRSPLLQAYIFALMTMMYVGNAVAHEHLNGIIPLQCEPCCKRMPGTTSWSDFIQGHVRPRGRRAAAAALEMQFDESFSFLDPGYERQKFHRIGGVAGHWCGGSVAATGASYNESIKMHVRFIRTGVRSRGPARLL